MVKTLEVKECVSLLKENETPRNIFLHIRKVNAVSRFLASECQKKGITINLPLLDTATLLHDVKKFHQIHGKAGRHNEEGQKMLESMGMPEAGLIVKKHDLKEILTPNNIQTWEEKITYYADDRVRHDEIVSIDERLDDLLNRYGSSSKEAYDLIESTRKPIKELEHQLFKELDINPEDITEENVRSFLINEEY